MKVEEKERLNIRPKWQTVPCQKAYFLTGMEYGFCPDPGDLNWSSKWMRWGATG